MSIRSVQNPTRFLLWWWVAAIAVLPGCLSYEAKPLSIDELSSAINDRAKTPLPVSPESVPPEATGGKAFDLRDGWNVYELQVVALYDNPDLKVERDKIGIAEGQLVSAGKIPNPVITDSAVLFPLGSGGVSVAINLAQPLLTAGKRQIAKEEATAEIARARAAVEMREWEVTREVKASYWRLQAVDERIRLEQENITLAEHSLAIAQARLDAGDTTSVDVDLAVSELGSRRSRLQTLLAEKTVAAQELARWLGLPPAIEFIWEKKENLYAAAPAVRSSQDLEKLALTSRPDIREARDRYQVAEKSLELAHANAYPNLDLGPGFEKAGGESPRLGVFLGLPIPLFYQGQGEIAQRMAEREQVRHEVESLLVRAKQEISSAAVKVTSLDRASQIYSTDVIPKLEEVVTRTQTSYQLGQVGAIELLQVQQSLVRARAEALDLLTQRQAESVALEKAVGTEMVSEVLP